MNLIPFAAKHSPTAFI